LLFFLVIPFLFFLCFCLSFLSSFLAITWLGTQAPLRATRDASVAFEG
jgi:hypothetical protein